MIDREGQFFFGENELGGRILFMRSGYISLLCIFLNTQILPNIKISKLRKRKIPRGQKQFCAPARGQLRGIATWLLGRAEGSPPESLLSWVLVAESGE